MQSAGCGTFARSVSAPDPGKSTTYGHLARGSEPVLFARDSRDRFDSWQDIR
jgi:hypothetical protein